MVDINSLYVVPLVLLLVIAVLAVLSTLHGADHSHRYRPLVAILMFPAKSRRSVRGLLYGFMLFILVWCIWSSPMWLSAWENSGSHKSMQKVQSEGH